MTDAGVDQVHHDVGNSFPPSPEDLDAAHQLVSSACGVSRESADTSARAQGASSHISDPSSVDIQSHSSPGESIQFNNADETGRQSPLFNGGNQGSKDASFLKHQCR